MNIVKSPTNNSDRMKWQATKKKMVFNCVQKRGPISPSFEKEEKNAIVFK